jgi:replicative superfamily II helicase
VSQDLNSTSASNGKQFVRQIGLLIIDEIHLLGEERGAVLEAIGEMMYDLPDLAYHSTISTFTQPSIRR